MALLFALYTYIIYIGYNWGAFFYKYILKSDPRNKSYNFFTGIILISIFSRIWSCFIPLNGWHSLILFLVALVNTKNFIPDIKKILKWQTGIIYLVAIPIIFFCSQQSISYDEALYHASFIQWLNDFGIVKGLGNLHGRLAFNSTWHLVAACFNFNFFNRVPHNQINGLMLLFFIVFFLSEIKLNTDQLTIKIFSCITIVCMFFPPIFVYHIIDPSSDYIVCYTSIIILYEIFFIDEKKSGAAELFNILILCFWLVTVKASSLTILIIPVFLIGRALRYKLNLTIVAVVTCLMLIPWVISNMLLSGYILYPSIKLGTDFSWQVPQKIAQADVAGIKYAPFMRWIGTDLDHVLRMGFVERYVKWFKGIRINDKMLFLIGIPMHLWMLFILRKASSIKIKTIISSLIGLIFIILTAPDFRFAAGYIFFIIIIFITKIFPDYKFGLLKRMSIVMSILLFTASVALYGHLKKGTPVVSTINTNKYNINIIFPEPYPKSRFTELTKNGNKFHFFNEQKNEFNWNYNPGIYDSTLKIRIPNHQYQYGIFAD